MRRLLVLLAFLSFASGPTGAADRQADGAAKRETPVAVGEPAPDFSLEDQDGRRHSLSAQRGKQPVVLVFYRGYW
jgi:cytochrome oxidase Cu insertion factor (SCO1/SenC/PrrC family)